MSPSPPIDRRRFRHSAGSSALVAGCSNNSSPSTARVNYHLEQGMAMVMSYVPA